MSRSLAAARRRSCATSPRTSSIPYAAADALLAGLIGVEPRRGLVDDRASVRRGRRADGPRHRPGPCRDRQGRVAVRAGPRPGRGRARADRRQPRARRWRRASSTPTRATRPSPGSCRRDQLGRCRRRRPRGRGGLRGRRRQAALWVELDGLAPPGAIFASNTSSISIDRLAAAVVATARRPQFVGMHFFSPVPVMPLVELIRGRDTTDATEAAIRGLVGELEARPRARAKQVISSRPTGPASSSTGS